MTNLALLPVELVERIVVLLPVEDIGRLRLTSRELRNKASAGSYLSNFITHKVDLNDQSLNALSSILSEDNLSRKLQKLTVIAPIYDYHNEATPITPYSPDWDPPLLSRRPTTYCVSDAKGDLEQQERLEERQRQARVVLRRAQHEVNIEFQIYPKLLKQCFDQIKEFCDDGMLISLRLHCMADAGDGPKLELVDNDAIHNNLSAHASYLFATTMNALAASRLSVQSLDILSTTKHCSLACTELAPYLASTPRFALRAITDSVRHLAIKFSRITDAELATRDPVCCECNTRKSRRKGADIVCHKHLSPFEDEDDRECQSGRSLADFVKLFINLEGLRLHQYEIEPDHDKHNPIVFEDVSQYVRIPGLQSFALRGVNADETSLSAFLTSHKKLSSLDMRHINLKEGQWQSILLQVKTQLPQLATLNLEDLFENKRADPINLPAQTHTNHVPPPPIIHPGFGALGQPPLPPVINTADTFLNTLLAFRVMNIPDEQILNSGLFKNNKVKINGGHIQKADILYGFVSHAANKYKLEKRWNLEQTREYGPLPRTPELDLF